MRGPMLCHLGSAARAARERTGLRQLDIATAAGMSEATVSRFEAGIRWPLDPDRLIDAYATETGIDAHALWRTAVESWQR